LEKIVRVEWNSDDTTIWVGRQGGALAFNDERRFQREAIEFDGAGLIALHRAIMGLTVRGVQRVKKISTIFSRIWI
jgi:hypothetical protein